MSTEDLISHITNQDFSKAGPLFTELLQAKVTDALDAERVKLANQVYNSASEEEELESDDDAEIEADTEEDTEDEESNQEGEETDEEEPKDGE